MNTPFAIDESHYRGLIYLALRGDIDVSSIETIRDHVVDSAGRDTTTELVVDLAAVAFIDAVGVGLLVACRDHVEAAGVAYRVINAQSWVRRMLDSAGVADAAADIPAGPVVVGPSLGPAKEPLIVNGLSG